MSEIDDILAAFRRARREGRPAVLATVVKVTGSAYRRPGARMIFPEGGDPVGMVSGGCLESDLAERATTVFESGEAHTVVYDMRSPDDIVWGMGLGCNGEVRVLLERLLPGSEPEHVVFLERCSRARRPGVVVTVFDGQGGYADAVGRRLLLDPDDAVAGSIEEPDLRSALLEFARRAMRDRRSAVREHRDSHGRLEALIEYVAPVVSLLVFGAGNDALPVVSLAKLLGWRVKVLDDRPAFARQDRFPAADAVEQVRFDAIDPSALGIDAATPILVMTHHFLHDLDLMQALLPTPTPYLGFLGPRQRTEHLLEQLAQRGVRPTEDQRSRLYGPVGIDLGAETPEEIALAALAEIRTVLSGRTGGFLRDRRGSLHEWPR